jgi:fucokinase
LPDGRSSTLFDEFIIAFSSVPSRMSPGMLLLSGDVLLVFNPLQIDLNYLDSSAISMKAPVQTGCNHGVFLSDKNNDVNQFLHKQSMETLKKLGATNKDGLVDIDTGAIFFNANVVNSLYSLISNSNGKIDTAKFDLFVNDISRISLYGDFVYPFAKESTLEKYLKEAPEGSFCEELSSCRNIIWEKLHNYTMRVIKLSPADFIHFGTTKELLSLVTEKVIYILA